MSAPTDLSADVLRLEGMRFFGHHGVTEAEREAGVVLDVDLDVRTDMHAASHSDRLEDTVDYSRLVEICRAMVEESRCRLLESLAERVAGAVLAEPGVAWARVRIAKRPPLPAAIDRFSVTIERRRP